MFIDRDLYGWYEKCLQCAYCCELRDVDGLAEKTRKEGKPINLQQRLMGHA